MMARLVTAAALLSILLAACGQKGALYLPPKNGTVITRPAAPTPAPAAAAQEKDKDKEKTDDSSPTPR